MAKEGYIRIGVDASAAKKGAEEAREALLGVGKAARSSATILDQLADSIDGTGKESKDAAGDVDKLNKKLRDAEKEAKSAAAAIGKVVAALGGLYAIYNVITTIKDFEDGLVGVGKTTNILGTDLDNLGQDIIGLSRGMRAGNDELLEIAQTAGQLGVSGKAGILAFTETVAMLGSASNLVGEEAATKLARMLNIAGEAPETVGTLAAVIVELGNNVAATEKEIAHTATQVGLATAAFGVSSAESAAFGATLAALGIRAELAGSSIGRTFRAIDKAVRGGGEQMQAMEKITGKTAEEISTTFKRSATEGFQLFIEGLGEIADAKGDVTGALTSIGLSGEEILKVMPTLALNAETFGNNIERAADQVMNATALQLEYARAMDTFGGELDRAGNAFDAWKLSMLATAGPMKKITGFIADVGFALAGVKEKGDGVTTGAEQTAVALRAVGAALIFPGALVVVSSLMTAFKSLKVATWAWNAALLANPIFYIPAAIGAVVGAYFLLSQEIDGATEAIYRNQAALDRTLAFADRLEKGQAMQRVAEQQGDVQAQIAAVRSQQQAYNDQLVALEVALDKGEIGAQELRPEDFAKVLDLDPDVLAEEIYGTLTKGIDTGLDTTRDALYAQVKEALGPQFHDAMHHITEEAGREIEQAWVEAQGMQRQLAAAGYAFDIGPVPTEVKDVPVAAADVEAEIARLREGFTLLGVTGAEQVERLTKALEDTKAEAKSLQEDLKQEDLKLAAPDTSGVDAALEAAKAKLKEYRESLLATEEALRRVLSGETTSEYESAEAKIQQQIASQRKLMGAEVDESKLLDIEARLRSIALLEDQIKASRESTTAVESIEAQTAALKAENEIRREGGQHLDIELQLRKTEEELREKGVADIEAMIGALRGELILKKELTEAERERQRTEGEATRVAQAATAERERASQAVADILLDLEHEKNLLGKNNFERQRYNELLRYEAALRATGKTNTDAALEAYEKEIRLLQEMAFYEDMAGSISSSFGQAFNDIIMGTKNAEDAFRTMMDQIGLMLLDRLVTQPMMEQLTEYLAGKLPDLIDVPEETLGASQAAQAQAAAAHEAAMLLQAGGVDAGTALTTACQTGAGEISAGCQTGAGFLSTAAAELTAAASFGPVDVPDVAGSALTTAAPIAAETLTTAGTNLATSITTAATAAATTLTTAGGVEMVEAAVPDTAAGSALTTAAPIAAETLTTAGTTLAASITTAATTAAAELTAAGGPSPPMFPQRSTGAEEVLESVPEAPDTAAGSALTTAATLAAETLTTAGTTLATSITTAATTAATTLTTAGEIEVVEGAVPEAPDIAAGSALTTAATTAATTLTTAGTTLATSITTAATTAATTLTTAGEIEVAEAAVEEAPDIAAGSALTAAATALTGAGGVLTTSAGTLTTSAGTLTAAGNLMRSGMIAGAQAIQAAAAALAAAAQAAAASSVATASAKGNVFSGGDLVPFAQGGIVRRTTTFPMADGRMGMMGEDGPEAIMPLERGADGNLGVRSSGQPQTVNNVTNVHMTVKATDADSFRRSRRQISSDLRRM